MSDLAAPILVGLGLALAAVGVLLKGREREVDLAAVLDLPYGERDVPVEAITERSLPLIGPAARVAGRLDRDGGLAAALASARVPMTSGEYVLAAAGAGIVAAAALGLLTRSWVFAVAGVLAGGYGASVAPRLLAAKRRRAAEEQLPDALATVAASVEAGHTFLRAVQMYAEEAAAPLSDELAQVVRETSLGDPMVDALDRMADRLRIPDLDWVVQAIRIQQETGGRLADMLHTLAEFMRAREEVRREVKVLTAEGRMSAMVLGAMPPLLFVALQVINPGYADPLLQGWGLVVLGGAVASTATGIALIVRMVKIEV